MCAQRIPTICTAPELNSGRGDTVAVHQRTISVIVPVYNNAGSLPLLHERLLSTLASMSSDFEIIYVNDGSTDSSYDVLVACRSNGSRVIIVDLAGNFGQSAAVLAGFSLASGAFLVTIDADLENNPEDIPALIEELRNGCDLCCGVRGRREAPFFTRKGPSWIANRLVGHALCIDLKDWGCGLNAVTSDIAIQMLAQEPLPALPKIEAAMLSSRIAQVPVANSKRKHGDSGYTVWRLCGFAITFLRGYSVTRTFRRLRSVPKQRSNRIISGATAIVSWSILSGASIIVRFALLLFGQKQTAKRFCIREVIE